MVELGKEEGNVIEEEGLNRTHEHAQLEGIQELKPSSVDGVIVEMQKLIGDSGVGIPDQIEAEDAENGADIVDGTRGGSDKDSDVHCTCEVCLKVESDKIVSNEESNMHCASEVCLKVESDKVVSDRDSDEHCKNEVAVEGKRDNVVGNVDSNVQRESEVCVETLGGESGKKEEEVKDVKIVEAVKTGEHVGNVNETAHTAMEIEKENNDGKEGNVLKDRTASNANEVHINAEPDVVVNRQEPDMCSDSEAAMEKLTDGGSSKAKPSAKLLTSSEADSVYDKLDNHRPSDSKIAKEKLVDAVSRKAVPAPNEPPSIVKQLKANNFGKVKRGIPQDDEVSTETDYKSDGDDEKGHAKFSQLHNIKERLLKPKYHVKQEVRMKSLNTERTFLLDPDEEGNESRTEEEQAEFKREVYNLYKEKHVEFKSLKFYKEELNLLKLWRAVIKLGGYEKVTSCKLWRQVGESFNPPKTCTTISWTFRIFYEKALLEFEKHRWHGSELGLPETSRVGIRADGSGTGRRIRNSAARAMQGWHSQNLLGDGEQPLSTMPKIDKRRKSSGLPKWKKRSGDYAAQVPDMRATKPRLDMTVFDIGPPADWVKIHVKRFSDCFEVYALVPGLLREEVHVQSDPIGRLIITGQPMQLDNPWGVTPFKKVVSLPSRIDPHQTSAIVTMNGQLFVRVPFEQSDN